MVCISGEAVLLSGAGSAHSESEVQVQALPVRTRPSVRIERGRVQLETAWKRRALASLAQAC